MTGLMKWTFDRRYAYRLILPRLLELGKMI